MRAMSPESQHPVFSKFAFARFALFALVLSLAACAQRGQLTLISSPDPRADIQTVFVATTRQKTNVQQGYGPQRSETTRFARFQVSVPPGHSPGKIEWPGQNPDPATDFITVENRDLSDKAAFRTALDAAFTRLPAGQRDAVVFVHGYNNTFAEGLYRLVQLSHDLNVGGVKLHYSWPSAGTERGYAYDRDSAAFARDGLQQLLEILAKSKAERVLLVAHSMGALVTVESLRQMYIGGDKAIAPKLSGVVLMSPDIDVDLFRSQLRRIRPLPKPFVIFSSKGDHALRLSALLTGENQRLGNLQSTEDLKGLGVLVVDLSNFKAQGDLLNHSSLATSPNLLAILRALPEVDRKLAPKDSAGRLLIPGLSKLQKSGYWLVPGF